MTAQIDALRFEPYELPKSLAPLRAQVREFLRTECTKFTAVHRSNSWDAYDAEFSRTLGERGWLGMTLPKAYGGH